jgi:predicted CopG family antitoxin
MAKNVALSDEVLRELNILKEKEGGVSYSQIIKKLLSNQPKTDAERLYEVFEPFKEGICKIITPEMTEPIEIFRIICIELAREKYKSKENIAKLVEVLGEYWEELRNEQK